MRLRGLFEGICVLCSLCLLMEIDWIPSNRLSRTRWNQSTQSNWQKLRSLGDTAKSNLHVTLQYHNIRKGDEDRRLSFGRTPGCLVTADQAKATGRRERRGADRKFSDRYRVGLRVRALFQVNEITAISCNSSWMNVDAIKYALQSTLVIIQFGEIYF